MPRLTPSVLRLVRDTYRKRGLDPRSPEVPRVAAAVVRWLDGAILRQFIGAVLCPDCGRVVAELTEEGGPHLTGPDLGLPDSAAKARERARGGRAGDAAREEARWAARRAALEGSAYPDPFIHDFRLELDDRVWAALVEGTSRGPADPEDRERREAAAFLLLDLWDALVPWIEFTLMRQLLAHLCRGCRRALEAVWYGDAPAEDLAGEGELG